MSTPLSTIARLMRAWRPTSTPSKRIDSLTIEKLLTRTRGLRAASEGLYRRRRYGRLGKAILERAASLSPPGPAGEILLEPRFAARPGAAVAFSPNPSGLPFAAADLEEEFLLPEEIRSSLPAATWHLTIFRKADGRPLQRLRWKRTA